jgi:hypothetical protein
MLAAPETGASWYTAPTVGPVGTLMSPWLAAEVGTPSANYCTTLLFFAG